MAACVDHQIKRGRGGDGLLAFADTRSPTSIDSHSTIVGDNWGWGKREVVCILQGGFHGCIWPNEVGLSAIV